MNKPKQATLFQSWGSRPQPQTKVNSYGQSPASNPKADHPTTIDLCDDGDDEDLELAKALEESLIHYQNTSSHGARAAAHEPAGQDPPYDHDGNLSFGIENNGMAKGGETNDTERHCLPKLASTDLAVADMPGFDTSAGHLWIYPTNYPVREYQFNIVKQALVKNTLVTLPTGLGKTFIASVVMYNFYRWYPEGKVIFMAPTKPLVAQQIGACYNIMGIPQGDTAEMTGTMNPTDRQKAWRDQRVFFLTPQVLMNDLTRGTTAAEAVKCLVVDEAHKALGNHAYCQVVRELVKHTRQFRILALSATPGSDIKAVQQVIGNLLVSHIELRSEESSDIKPYTHERTVEKIVVPLGDELNSIKAKYIQVLSVVVKRLIHQRVLYNREPTSLSKFLILKAREAFRQNPPEHLPRSQYGVVEGDFALAMSLYHGYELLQLHGLRSLFNFLHGVVSGDKAYGRTRSELQRNADFCAIMDTLQDKFPLSNGPGQSSSYAEGTFTVGHPKMEKLDQVVLEHFHKCQAEGRTTRVMIFSQYRDSVQEITQMLQQHEPLVKVMSFIGQSSAGKATKGFTQKEQLKVMQAFRTGGYNTLVSTCVGEEGLDIGDVDLIVCFDAHKSPIRLVQRMGRTGRKRQGRIVMLVTEGKEEQIYNHSQYTKRSIHRAILNGAKSLVFYTSNPRMIPANLSPACHRMHITVQHPPDLGKGQGQGKGRKSQGKISTHHTKGKSARGAKVTMDSHAGISLEEFMELRSTGSALTTKCLPAPKMVSLQSPVDENDGEPDFCAEGKLNLADWLPWQNSLQQTSQFGHGIRSRHLVELLEFTDLQQILPPDEDNYGQEMATYLNMEDVPRPATADISHFCVPANKQGSHAGNGDDSSRQQQSMRGKKTSRTKRKKTALPAMEVEQDSDSDGLPDVDFSKSSASAMQKCSPRENSGADSWQAASISSVAHGKERRKRETASRASSKPSVISPLAEFDECDDFELDDARRDWETNGIQESTREQGYSPHASSVNIAQIPCGDIEVTLTVIGVPTDIGEGHDINKDVSVNVGDSVTNEVLFRVPTPPPLEEIVTLLDNIENPKSFFSVDLASVLQICSSQSRFRLSCQPHTSDQIHTPEDGETDRHENMEQPAKDNQGWAEEPESAASVTNMNLQVEHSFSDSLDDTDFDAVTNRLLHSHHANKQRRDSELEHCDTNKVPSIQESKSENHKQQGQFSQTASKNKTPLFKGFGDTRPNSADLTEQHRVMLEENKMLKKRRSNFMYPMQQPVTGRNSVKECDVKMSGDPLMSAEIHRKHSDEAGRGFDESSRKIPDLPDSWITGRQLLQSVPDSAGTHQTQHSTHHPEMSISQSFLGKHFLDDAGDGGFADIEMCDSAGQQASLPLTLNRPGRIQEKTHHSDKEPEENLSCKDIYYTPALFAPEAARDSSLVPVASLDYSMKSDSMFTFTQALTCVNNHSHSERSYSDSKESHSENVYDLPQTHSPVTARSKLTLLSTNVENEKMENTVGAEFHEHEDSPNFDLGFDFEEDIIPPSPEVETSVLQPAFRPQISVKASASVGVEEISANTCTVLDCGTKDHDFEDDVIVTDKNMKEDSPQFSSSFQCKRSPVAGEMKSVTPQVMDPVFDLQFEFEDDFDSDFDEPQNKIPFQLFGANSSPGAAVSSQGFACNQQLNHDIQPQASDKSSDHNVYRHEAKTEIHPAGTDVEFAMCKPTGSSQLRLSDIGANQHEEHSRHSDEDLGRHSPHFMLLHDLDEEFECEQREQPAQKSSSNIYCSTPLSSKKFVRFTFQDKTGKTSPSRGAHLPEVSLEKDDGSDFEESVIVRKKSKGTKLSSSESEEDGGLHVKFKVPGSVKRKTTGKEKCVKKKKSKKSKGCAFLDDEAELSDDVAVSSDEAENNLDMMEASFIDNDTQMTQASQTDMQAVYMKSVQSPLPHGAAGGARFRLQYQPAHMDVFSQPPQHGEEESQYQEDSFCVGSGEEEEESYESEDDTDEFDLTSLKREQSDALKRKKKQNVKQVTGRKRVRQLADSSSDDEEDVVRLPPSQTTPAIKRPAAVRALLSSSEDNLETSVAEESLLQPDKNVRPLAQKTVPSVKGGESSQGFQCAAPKAGNSDSVCASERTGTCLQRSGGNFSLPDKTRVQTMHLSATSNVGRPSCTSLSSAGDRKLPHAGQNRSTASVSFSPQPGTAVGQEEGGADACSSSRVPEETGASHTGSDSADRNTFTSIACRERGKIVLLVDSREISGAQDVVSALRLQHNIHVCTRQLSACDYILSNRMAVERLTWSGFSASTNKDKLCERLQRMQSLYDRCVVVVEKDRVKPGEEKMARPQQHSKYVDSLIAQLSQTSIRLFFTDNQSETAKLLAALCSSEKRKNMSITAPVSLSQEKEQILKFYLSIPMLSVTHALNLCFNFSSVDNFLQSPAADIQKKGQMSLSRATEAYNFIRHRFSAALM